MILKQTMIRFFLLTFYLMRYSSDAQFLSNLLPSLQTAPILSDIIEESSNGIEFRQRENLNQSTGLGLEWEIIWGQDHSSSNISFIISISADSLNNNSVLFLGVSRTGQVEGADVVALLFGGSGGLPSILDMHGVDNVTLASDITQNWRLVSTQRNASHVSVNISRLLDTCDEQDVIIGNDMANIIWGQTEVNRTENGSFTFTPQGSMQTYLTDPVVSPTASSTGQVQTWRVSRRFNVPARHTSYWCTIHRGLPLQRKHHIVGFAPYFRDELSLNHTHHQLLHRCTPPPGVDPALAFERFIGHPGEECYLEGQHHLPTLLCTESVHYWGLGAKSFDFPNDLGFPMGETANEYFMLETHFNNPESRSDLMLETGIDLRYTSQLRPYEGHIIFTGSGIFGLFQVPPHTQNFTIAGHCSPECTLSMAQPYGGIDIAAVSLHGHSTVRKIKMKHYRGKRELPWISYDNNYNTSYQHFRLLPEPVKILPGDQITTECEIDTRARNGTTLNGFSGADEMCIIFVIIKQRIPQLFCTSEYPTQTMMQRYGVTNMTWDRESQVRVVHSAENPEHVGLLLSQVIDNVMGDWTPEQVRELEREQLYGHHDSSCVGDRYLQSAFHPAFFADDLSGGLIPARERIQYLGPSTRTINTFSAALTGASYQTDVTAYREPQRNCTSRG